MTVTLTQHPDASFPDRPIDRAGVGVRALATDTGNGEYIVQDLGTELPLLHVRVLFAPGTTEGGEAVILRGLDSALNETFRVGYDADSRVVTVTFGATATFAEALPPSLAWHCIELELDTAAGQSAIWINGVQRDTEAASYSSLATRHVWLGLTFKSTAFVGECWLDEWVISDSYIGLVNAQRETRP